MITVALCRASGGGADQTIELLAASPLVSRILVVHDGNPPPAWPKCQGIRGDTLAAGWILEAILKKARTRFTQKRFRLGSRSKHPSPAIAVASVVAPSAPSRCTRVKPSSPAAKTRFSPKFQ